MTLIKVCGVTTVEDAIMVARAGVDWVGLNFWGQSKRVIDPVRARAIVSALKLERPELKTVGLFVNHTVERIDTVVASSGVDYVQLHGDETPAFAKRYSTGGLKAVSVSSDDELAQFCAYDCEFMLVDAKSPQRGGTGTLADWQFGAQAVERHARTFLAGGLNADNVAEAIRQVQPYGVDVASGVESSPGVKDAEKVARFVTAVRGCQ